MSTSTNLVKTTTNINNNKNVNDNNNDIINNNRDEVTFIERKKYIPLGDRMKNYFDNYSKHLLISNYKNEKLLFRVIYDKIYRPELYTFVNTIQNVKEVNMLRNIFTMNETKYDYNLIKENNQLKIEDDEIYTENNFLRKVHKYYKMYSIFYYMTGPLFFISSYFALYEKRKFKMFLFLIATGSSFLTSIYAEQQKKKLLNSELSKLLTINNSKAIDKYKIFFYDDY
jgi:hypothetical protein